VFFVNNCQKASSDKIRFAFDLTLRDKQDNANVYTYQALSQDDYKAWFAVMEGKQLTPVTCSLLFCLDEKWKLKPNKLRFF